ncbi:MAG: folate family ECF transporter S component [Clostridia bacterium]|nr:folate family ECF transporter S component [Clostridia bacterium]
MKKENRIRLFGSIKVLCTSAILTSMAVAIAYICKIVFPEGSIRITFENLPIIFAGFMFGPWVGLAVGLCTDLISSIAFYGLGRINPLITAGAGLVGLMSGLMSVLRIKSSFTRLLLSVFTAHIMGNMIVKSIGLMLWYHMPVIQVLPRIPLYTVIAVIEFCLLSYIVKSNAIRRMISK